MGSGTTGSCAPHDTVAVAGHILTHINHDWEYTCIIKDGVPEVTLQETKPVLVVDYLMYHESNKEFREAALAKAEPHHGQHPLEHMLRLEVVDMQRVRSDRFGMYHAYSRRARDWAVQLCEVDFSEKVRKKEVSASDHTMTGK